VQAVTPEPFSKILDRFQSKADAKDLVDRASPLLEEVINYSTWAYGRCLTTSDTTYEDLPVFVLYLHIMEMTDAVHILISQSCCEPSVPILRSSFEAFLSLQYLLKEDYRNRSMSWLYFDYRSKTRSLQKLDPQSHVGKEFGDALGRETSDVRVPRLTEQQLKYIRERSSKEVFRPIEVEYARTKGERKLRIVHWYTLFGGPPDIQRLAAALSLEHIYITFYREWAASAHAGDSSRYVETLPDGTVASHQLRLARNLLEYAFYGVFFVWAATDSMLRKFRPFEPNHAKWSDDIRSRLDKLQNVKIDILPRS